MVAGAPLGWVMSSLPDDLFRGQLKKTTLKGLHIIAQGKRAARHPGLRSNTKFNPEGVYIKGELNHVTIIGKYLYPCNFFNKKTRGIFM
jgi:hypothetical protein